MTTTRMRLASTLAMMLGALAGNETMPNAFNTRPDPRGPAPRNQSGFNAWASGSSGTYNRGRNAQKRARRALERQLRADEVAFAGGRYRVPKHRLAR